MNRFFREFLLAILISALFSASLALPVQGQTTVQYLLDIGGSVWDHAVLTAIIVAPDNESWWNPLFLNATLRAIGQWNDAISDFSATYSDYSYLSNVQIQPVISNVNQSNFDIYINWAQLPLSNSTEIVGLAQTFSNSRKTIINSTINLATHTNHGVAINEGDAQNIALHELGHSLGLGHSNYTGDLMYPLYTMRTGEELVSTLDVYGVATIFGWQQNVAEFYPVDGWLKQNYVILPSTITFQHLSASPENAHPQSLENNPVVQTLIFIFQLLIHPEICGVVLVVIVVFVVLFLISRRRKPN
jgi:predicted Zn-dependent protease